MAANAVAVSLGDPQTNQYPSNNATANITSTGESSSSLRTWSSTSNEFGVAWYVHCQCGRAHWIGLPNGVAFDVELKDAGYSSTHAHETESYYRCDCDRLIEYKTAHRAHINAHEVMTSSQHGCMMLVAILAVIALFIVVTIRN